MDTNTRQAKRAPVTLKIKFKSATLDQFIERYAVDVSPGGIFIRTKEPLAVGTQMRFEFQLRDATPLITGEGTVVWTRENDPTRPAAAPGMGVRFDRLGDGSQTILDKILAEKAKQPGTGPVGDGAPKGFLEVPTKVAPSPLVGALASESKQPKLGTMAPSRGSFADERTDNTPLPRPMPFHSDAEEFPDEAFEEATKVRALDELVAATASDSSADAASRKAKDAARARVPEPVARPEPVAKAEPVKPAPVVAAAVPAPLVEAPRPAPVAEAKPKAAEPEAKVEAKAKAPEPKPAPKSDAKTDSKTDAKPAAKKPTAADELAARRGKADEAAKVAPAAATAATEPEPGGKAPTAVIVGLLLAAVVAAAVWFMFLRKPQVAADGEAGTATATASGTATPGTQVGTAGTASADVGTGSAAAVTIDAGAAMVAEVDAGAATPMVETGTVEIKTAVAGATVEVEGGATGAAPFTATLEKGKTYKVTVRADTYKPSTIEVTVGTRVPLVKLEPLPRLVHITSTPAGAAISIDGIATGKKTPADIALSKTQLAQNSVRLGLRRTGFAAFTKAVAKSEFVAADDGASMVATLDATLTAVRDTGGGGGGGGDGSGTAGAGSASSGTGGGSGSAAGGGAGSASGTGAGSASGTGAGSGSAAGSGKGTGAGSAAGSGKGTGAGTASGSGEPVPDWMNQP